MTNIFRQSKKSSLVVLFVLVFTLFLQNNSYANDSTVILFWGEGCPHCEVVKDKISENGYDKKINIDYKEIYRNKDNAKLFYEKINECGISSYNAGVPMVYANGLCWIGQNEAIYAIEKEIEKNTNSVTSTNENEKPLETTEFKSTDEPNSTDSPTSQSNQEVNTEEEIQDKGKRNTEIMLLFIFITLVAFVGVGYTIQNKKSKVLTIVLVFTLCSTFSLLSIRPVYAVCPVCTVAVGAGLGLSRYLGIDDVITSLWIGGLIVSTIYWIIDWLGKRNKKGLLVNLLTTVFTYIFVLVPLYLGGLIGNPFNTFLGMDKILLGTIIGSIAFFFGAQLHFSLKRRNNDNVVIPFQKVIVPVGALWLMSLIFYFIIY